MRSRYLIIPVNYEEWQIRKKILIANGVHSPDGGNWNVGSQGDPENDAPNDVNRIANVMNNAESHHKARWYENTTIQKAINEITSDNQVKNAGLAALVLFGVVGIAIIIYGIVLCSTLDVHDEGALVIIRNFGGYFALTSLIPIFCGVFIANHKEKATLCWYTKLDESSNKRVLKNLSAGNTPSITGWGNDATGTRGHTRKFARANFVASVYLGDSVNDAGETVNKESVGGYISKVKSINAGNDTNAIDEDEFDSTVTPMTVKNQLTSITGISGATDGHDKFRQINIAPSGNNLDTEAAKTVTILKAIKGGSDYNSQEIAKNFIDTLYTLIKGYDKQKTDATAIPKPVNGTLVVVPLLFTSSSASLRSATGM